MKKVLIVDDEPHIIRVMSMGLRRVGYDVISAKNGLEGLESFKSNQPDALVADVDMPKMNGIQMCTEIRKAFPDTECKVFVSTSRAETGLRVWAKEVGKVHFLEKPISMRTLTSELEKHFSVNDE